MIEKIIFYSRIEVASFKSIEKVGLPELIIFLGKGKSPKDVRGKDLLGAIVKNIATVIMEP